MRRDAKRVAKRKLKNVDALLEYLCVEMGFCEVNCVDFDPLPSVNEFADAILRAEGFDPTGYCEYKKSIRQIVADSYRDMGIAID